MYGLPNVACGARMFIRPVALHDTGGMGPDGESRENEKRHSGNSRRARCHAIVGGNE